MATDRLSKLFEQYKMQPHEAAVKSRAWFNQEVAKMNAMRVNRRLILNGQREETVMMSRFMPGSLYLFEYAAKHAATLPYWDRYPLVIPIVTTKVQPGSFHGINLHYLHPQMRAQLLDKLMVFATNDKMDETTKLRMTYATATAAAKNKYIGACVKMYLTNHVQSRPVKILPEYWVSALMLPVESFQGATKEAVWRDSRRL